MLEVSQRDRIFSTLKLSISGAVGDKNVDYFITDESTDYYMHKVDGYTFELYAHINYIWGALALHRISGYRCNNGINITVNLERADSIPSGSQRAIKTGFYYSGSTSTTKASIDTGY